MSGDRMRELVLGLAIVLGLAASAGAQSVRLNRELAQGNLHRGTAALTRDGRWVVFAGRYDDHSPGVNSLYGAASDGSSEPFLLYDHGDIPGVAREFDPGTVTFVHLTPNSRWAVFTVDERGSIYSARLSADRRIRSTPRSPDPFLRLAQADTSRDFQLDPAGERAVFFHAAHGHVGPALHSVPVDGSAPAVELVGPDEDGTHQVLEFAIDASARRVVFLRGDAAGEFTRRLYSVPIDGSEAPTRLSPRALRSYAGNPTSGRPGPAPAAGVLDYKLAPDGAWVLFRLQEDGLQEDGAHLYAVPTDGSGSARRLASGVDVAAFTPDSTRVVYRTESGGGSGLLVQTLDGGAGALLLHEPADLVETIEVLPEAALFVESGSGAEGARLWQVELSGQRRPRPVSAELSAGRSIRAFRASPDREHVVFSADAEAAGVFTLFMAPLRQPGASGHTRPIGGPRPDGLRAIGGSADVARFVFTPDSAAVLAHVASSTGLQLERVSLDGHSVRRLSGAEGASDLELDAAGTVAMYRGARAHDTRVHVYTVALDVSLDEAAPSRQIDDFGPVLGGLYSYELHPNGREALFAAGSRDYAYNELHRVPLDLSGPPRILQGLLVGDEQLLEHRIEPHSGRVVYRVRLPDPFSWLTRLYSAPHSAHPEGSGSRASLDAGPEAQAEEFAFAHGRVVYRATLTSTSEGTELFSVPADGTSASARLSATLPVNGRVDAFEVSPDGTRVVYLGSQNVANRAELFSVPADGSAPPVQLNPVPVAGGEVWRGPFRIAPDGSRVLFAGDLVLNNAFGLWSAPLLGGGAVPLWIPPANREVERLAITPDSARAVFTADGLINNVHQLYVVPLDGSAAATPLPASAGTPKVFDFGLTPDGTRVVYVAGGIVASVALDGSASPAVLSSPLVAGGRIVGTPAVSDEWVLYQADQEVLRRYDLHVVPVDGSAPARRLNDPPGSGGADSNYAIAGDEALFLAQVLPVYGTWQLFRAPLAGGPARVIGPAGAYSPRVSLSGPFVVHPDEHRVLFSAGDELYLGFLGPPIRGASAPR